MLASRPAYWHVQKSRALKRRGPPDAFLAIPGNRHTKLRANSMSYSYGYRKGHVTMIGPTNAGVVR
jgi:hypothetical protein